MLKATKFYLSFFGAGHSPYAPGTIGSIACLPVLYLVGLPQSLFLRIFLTVLICTLNIYLTKFYLHKGQNEVKDPQWIVQDEVSGMLVAFLFLPHSFISSSFFSAFLITLIFFRIFDITKIWPANYFDRQNSAFGINMDDIVSGLYAGLFSYLTQLIKSSL